VQCFKGKHIGRLGQQDPGEFPEEVKALFEKAEKVRLRQILKESL